MIAAWKGGRGTKSEHTFESSVMCVTSPYAVGLTDERPQAPCVLLMSGDSVLFIELL